MDTRIIVSIPTDFGDFTAVFSELGLAELYFPDRSTAPKTNQATHTLGEQTRASIAAIMTGQPQPAAPPLDLSRGTDFQRFVWEAMLRIPCGHTQSYGEIANALGKPGATRAVGTACGANPIPLIVPCHRVLAAGGRIGGFSAGLHWKRHLLEREGILLPVSSPAKDR